MLSRTFLKIVSVFVLGFAVITASAFALTYAVKKGDTLSTIAQQKIPHAPYTVYSPRGALEKLLALNPQIKNPHLVAPGDEINLSSGDAQLADLGPIRAPAQAAPEVPAKEPTQVTAPVEPIKVPLADEKSPGYGIASLSPEFTSSKIEGTDKSSGAKANLVSKSNYGLTAVYSQVWNSKIQTDFFFNLSKLSIKQPSVGGTIADADQTLYAYGATGHYHVSPKLMLGTGLGITQRTYLRAISATQVALDATSVPYLFVQSSYDFFRINPFTMGALVNLGVDLPSTDSGYKTQLNPSYGANLYVRHDISSSFVTETGLRATYQQEDTSIATQSQTDYGIYLKLLFSFGKGK